MAAFLRLRAGVTHAVQAVCRRSATVVAPGAPGRATSSLGHAGGAAAFHTGRVFKAGDAGFSQFLASTITAGKMLVVPYVGLLALMVTFQRQIIYPRPSEVADPTTTGGDLYYVPVGEPPDPRNKVAVVHFPVDDPAAPTLVFFHGNGDQLGWGAAWLGPIFQQLGCAFYGVEYPGYGLSQGSSPSEHALCSAAERAVAYLTAPFPAGLGVPPEQVVLFGQSIGGGVAMHLASKGLGARLVLLSAFTSVPEMAQSALLPTRILPLALLQSALVDKFDNAAKAPAITMPVCILHGDRDGIVPFAMGERLHKLMPHSEFHRLLHAGHNDVFMIEGDHVARIVADFAKADA